jgi:transposase-like protein
VGQQVEVSASDIARIAGVRPSAVSNWRRRHGDFPGPIAGTEKSPRFRLADVEEWLRAQGKAPEIPALERLWQTFESAHGTMSLTEALAMAGILLYHLGRHPQGPMPSHTGRADIMRLMERAPQSLVFGDGGSSQGASGNNSVAGGLLSLISHLPRLEAGTAETAMLEAVASAAAEADPAEVFDYLCDRVLDPGPRAGLAVTPPGLAGLMLDLAPPGARRILDPSCGSGTILLAAARRGYDRVEGQEADAPLAVVAALRVAFSGGASFDVHGGDSLRDDAYTGGTADAVVCNPPFADRNWGAEDAAGDLGRWEYGVPPRLESELAWVQHALWHARPGGTVVVLMPPAAAARPSGRRIRSRLLQAGAFRAVISLPPRLAAHYALALQVWVLTKPAKEHSPRPVLMIDASGFAASGQSRAGARPSDTVPTWDEVRTLIQRAWATFSSDNSGLPDNAGGTGDGSIGSDLGSVAAPVPVGDLLGEDVDITPARHLPSVPVARVSLDILTRHRSSLQALLAELPHLLPDLPPDRPLTGSAPRESSLEELAQSGMLYIRRTAPRAVIQESSLPKVRRIIITGRDLVRAVPPAEEDDVLDDEVLSPRVREGDVLVPHVARQLIARVAQGQDVGAALSSSVVLIRPDSAVLDPWYLAGLLSSSDSGRQAARMASTIGDTIRFDPRRVRIPILPIEDQRTHGAAFRRLADLARTLRAAHDEGNALIRDLIDATVSSISAAPELQR